ncbi:MAG: thioredoxin-disulfide reductase [Tissierellia bacterium]|nr:thioredoxin-disulfide reductase [Tissierellia bacterium]
MDQVFDIVIIGAGPAGLSAGLYAGRSKMKALILEKDNNGGQIAITHAVENYPGSIENATGPSLTKRMVEQCQSFGTEIVRDTIESLELDGDVKKVIGEKGTYLGKTVIIATGADARKIGCPGEKMFAGKGVSYCATCDADFFEELEVFVVGGGDSAITEALYLTRFARKVTIVHRREGLRANKDSIEIAKADPKIHWKLHKVVKEIKGDGILESIVLEDTRDGELEEIFADEDDGTMGVFVFIGMIPHTELVKDILATDDEGYLITDDEMKTSIPGVFVAGDVRSKKVRQVVTAASDGAVAAISAEHFIFGTP